MPSTTDLLPADAKPPKSKSAAYYSIHPDWQDVLPIPQVDQTGALAAIAYSPRYSEAMSYLRALMAENEISERALMLTEDLISMNPAHYTVWIYRMQVLRGLWETSKATDRPSEHHAQAEETQHDQGPRDERGNLDGDLWDNIQNELKWLDEVSFRNLKNYQIWHHRQSLVDLLPLDPASVNKNKSESNLHKNIPQSPLNDQDQQILTDFVKSEQKFLAQILSLDTKNYHVWSYRQWLCNRFPCLLLPNPPHAPSYDKLAPFTVSIADVYRKLSEVAAMDTMIDDDLRNNSAWSHRYFILFGHHELSYAQSQKPPLVLKQVNQQQLLHKAGLMDMDLVEAEIEYTKAEIRKAPQNGSTWNYLRGVLRHGALDITTTRKFCEEFLGPEGDLWTDQWIDVELEDSSTGSKTTERQEIGVRSSHAVEWLSEIYSLDGSDDMKQRSRECLKALSEKWDPIRKGYWDWRGAQMDEAVQ